MMGAPNFETCNNQASSYFGYMCTFCTDFQPAQRMS